MSHENENLTQNADKTNANEKNNETFSIQTLILDNIINIIIFLLVCLFILICQAFIKKQEKEMEIAPLPENIAIQMRTPTNQSIEIASSPTPIIEVESNPLTNITEESGDVAEIQQMQEKDIYVFDVEDFEPASMPYSYTPTYAINEKGEKYDMATGEKVE